LSSTHQTALIYPLFRGIIQCFKTPHLAQNSIFLLVAHYLIDGHYQSVMQI